MERAEKALDEVVSNYHKEASRLPNIILDLLDRSPEQHSYVSKFS
ncbi:MAG: hypothetical protein OFPII_31120 [Osedax symbiont Rs1]|nr:MAG: hypothetical protein OFPII_31120 [Osedax symbiont Rs1]